MTRQSWSLTFVATPRGTSGAEPIEPQRRERGHPLAGDSPIRTDYIRVQAYEQAWRQWAQSTVAYEREERLTSAERRARVRALVECHGWAPESMAVLAEHGLI